MTANIIEQLKGVGAALITPFTEDGRVDFEAFQRLLEHTGPYLDYFVVNGTTAESPTLSAEEVEGLLHHIKENNPWKKPVVFGVGGNHTAQVVEKIKQTDFEGIDAILSSSPAYNKPTQEGVYQHYHAIAEACPVPVILYNVPGRTASNMNAKTTVRLSQHPNIIGVKEASGDLVQCMTIAKHAAEGFLLISGDDLLTTPIISIGGHGLISVIANAFPKQVCAYTHHALQGDYTEANRLLQQQIETTELLFAEGNPAGVKIVLEQLGVCTAQVRLPLVKGSETLRSQLVESMQEIE